MSLVITVDADVPMVDADSSSLGAVVDQHKVIELPLNGRGFYQLTDLVPGAAPGAEGSQNVTTGGAVTVNGMRDQSNNFLLDGIDNNDQSVNQAVVPPPIDSVREFKVQSGNYGAEFGSRAGAQLNFVTKSGTNQFNFKLYEFHRNASLDAKNFFDPPDTRIPRFIRNQFGFSAGGPIVTDRTFFFGNYEGLRERKAITQLATVPPDSFVQGDFSSLPLAIRNPLTGEPFPGNIIPPDAQSPIGAAIADFFPSPNVNQPGGNLLSQPVRRKDVDQFVVRIDHQSSQTDSFFGRYGFFDEDRFEPFDPLIKPTNIPGFGSLNLNRGQNLALGWTRFFGATLLNDLRVGFNRLRGRIFQEKSGDDVSSRLGIRGLSTDAINVGFPATVVVGFDALSSGINQPQQRVTNAFQLVDSLSWLKGRHTFKLGADLRHVRLNVFLNFIARGQFVYTGAVTNHPLADLLLGAPTLAIGTEGDTAANLRTSSYNFYFMDDFKVSQSLTLNYGVRYEYNQPAYEVKNRFTRPDLDSPTARFVQCGTEGIPRACYDSDRNNFAPRIGLAWSPFQTETVLRAGYGVFYDVGILNYSILPRFNPPNFGTNIFFFPALADPFSGGAQPSPLITTVAEDFPTAYAQHWSLSFQHGLSDDYLLDLSYVGTKGTKLVAQENINQPRPGGTPPFPYGPIGLTGPSASSSYHGLLVRMERRFQDGFSFLSSYTLSKSIDNGSSWNGASASPAVPQDSLNRAAERGLSDFDSRQRLALNSIWELPLGEGRRFLNNAGAIGNAILKGWQLAGILTFQSSRPFSPLLVGTNDSTTDNSTGFGTGTDRPNLVGNPHLDDPDPSRWFNTSAFERPSGTFGSAGRNILRGPGFHSVDLALMKQWSLPRERRVQFRAEFFNLLNTPNFDLPIGDFNNPNFGSVTSAKDSRQIQFGLRLEF